MEAVGIADTRIQIKYLHEWSKGEEWAFDKVQNPYTTVWLIINGERELAFNDQSHRITSGDLIIIPPNTPFSLRLVDTSPETLQYLAMGCEWKLGVFDFVNLYKLPRLTHLENKQYETLAAIWRSLRQSWDTFAEKAIPEHAMSAIHSREGRKVLSMIKLQTDQVGEFFAIQSLLFQWLAVMFQLLHKQLPATPMIMDDRVQKVCHYISHHYRDKLTMHSLCQIVYMSESQLRALFNKALNVSPMNYILQVRLQKAKELLMLTEEPVGSIADAVGFSDASYFCRVFRKTENVSPIEYRQLYKNAYV